MPYNNLISRTDVQALIPEDVYNGLLQGMTEDSAVLRLFSRVPMSSNQTRMPVISALPTAYFVNGDTGLKQTTEAAWANKFLDVEELAAIVPIPEAVLDDAAFDVWGALSPLLEEAIGRALDAAVFFGTNKPASWPDAIVTAAVAAGNTATRGTNPASEGGIVEDVNDVMSTVEADGFDVNGFVTSRAYRARLRSARDTTGQRLLDVSQNEIEGAPVVYAMSGLWPSGVAAAELVAGDFTQGIVGVRQDMTFRVLDQAVIQDNTGAIVYNLAQQDMVALRVTFRVAFQIANTLNRTNEDEGTRYPFGVLRAA